MKYKIALLVLMLPLITMGQGEKWEPKNKPDSVIYDLMDSWDLGINDDISQPVNITVFNKFKTLFDTAATIDDEFNAKFKFFHFDEKEKRSEYKYQLDSAKPFDVYAHDVALEVAVLAIDDNSIKVNSKGSNVYEISRKVTAKKYGQYVFENDTAYFNLEIKNRGIEFEPESDKNLIYEKRMYNVLDSTYKFVSNDILIITLNDNFKITSIKRKNNNPLINCIDDGDADGVLDFEDQCPGEYGDLTAHGCPDNDFDGVKNKDDKCKDVYGSEKNSGCPAKYFTSKSNISLSLGLSYNLCPIKLPEPDQLGYNDVDMTLSQKGNFKDPGGVPSAIFNIDYSYYFGKKAKNFGVSLGLIAFSGYDRSYEVDQGIITTFKANDGTDDYRRSVTIKNGSIEKIGYHVYGVPLLFKWRFKPGAKEDKKFAVEISLGPSFMYFLNSSDYNVNMNYEGLYQLDSINIEHPFTYYESFDANSTWNVLLTAADINNQSPNPGADSVFSQLGSSYDFANNKNYSGTDKSATRLSVAVNLNIDGISKLKSSNTAIKYGFGLVISPSLTSADHYHPMNSTKDGYNSLYRSKVNSLYTSYNFHVGIIIGL